MAAAARRAVHCRLSAAALKARGSADCCGQRRRGAVEKGRCVGYWTGNRELEFVSRQMRLPDLIHSLPWRLKWPQRLSAALRLTGTQKQPTRLSGGPRGRGCHGPLFLALVAPLSHRHPVGFAHGIHVFPASCCCCIESIVGVEGSQGEKRDNCSEQTARRHERSSKHTFLLDFCDFCENQPIFAACTVFTRLGVFSADLV